MMTVLMSFGVGIVVGAVFTLLHLPLPAPPTLSGVLGIVGIFCGMWLTQYLIH
ncbi:MAG: XapX domain-containing protein [Sulfobacillus thermosulfidooxidans]|uniref:XapX domain-containing protein n=1 Tax=Sulfobacillus thermotolerans TaxID=338644 RepID=A0ABN5H2G9_9FIRM|nr:DUF1427 family protein [Sulfobacillus sp. hq2]AUW93818.1 hypothetical protein BXT84_07580 [Sulfobacillus thermotolerans]MCY0908750.1 DUF1427 family protein [Sulfobacillus thermotolerans]POB11369.1 XapX domain-containing protein [Sulfobacillus sp. hq2]PSR36280.1 MAG: XapX domain-containing protein [Sulfobacillus thermosulfidooxidans]